MAQTFPNGIVVQDAAVITDTAGQESTIRLDGDAAVVTVGKTNAVSMLKMQDTTRNDQVWLMGNGDVLLNGSLWCGPLLGPGTRTFNLVGSSGDFNVTVPRASPQGTLLYRVLSFTSRDPYSLRATLILGGAVSGSGTGGDLRLLDFTGQVGIQLDGHTATAILGGNGPHSGTVVIKNAAGLETVRMDGARGDIVLQNADCAEDFDVQDAATVEPGMVLVIADDGKLCVCDTPYNKRVAGVVSGANGCRPALVLGRGAAQENDRMPIALNGKVYCWVDADLASIEVGDMLTTSSTPGHAMKVSESANAFGAVLGKALAPQRSGRSLIPIIVTLQ